MRQQHILILIILTLSVILISCSDLKRDLPTSSSANAQSYGPYECTSCHGDVNSAPPKDLVGNTSTSFPGVGVHQSHLIAVHNVGAATACNECHVVPVKVGEVGHMDLTTRSEVVFNGDVSAGSFAHLVGADTAATYSNMTLTCSNTYCHGNFPNGNNASPTWTDVSGQYRACGSCHGDPSQTTIASKALPKTPPNGGFHPNNTNCSRCHPSTINANYQLTASKHINGKID